MRVFGCGHDHGNSRTTDVVYLNGQEVMLTFPSATSDGSLKQLAKMRRAEGNDGIVVDYQALRKDEHVLVYDDSERFVGNLALLQGQGASTGRGDIHRYWSQRSLETLLTAAGTIIPDTNFELLVVTGLPVETFNEETRKRVKAALNGMHHFKLNGRERMAYVKVGKVLMEGAGAALLYGIEDNDNILGFIDIGGYSTDLYVRRGLSAIAPMCKGLSIGIEQAGEKVSTWFEEKYGFALSVGERTRILHAYATGGTLPTLHADWQAVPEKELLQWTDKACHEVGREIAEFVSRVWRTSETGKVAANFARVDVIGGGAYYCLPSIQQIIPRASVPEQPEHANARGYGWFADQLVQQRAIAAS